jgi:T5SS/PEP-CTERM-associated repeat protein
MIVATGGLADLTIGSGGTVQLAGNEQIAEFAGNEVVVLGGGLLDVNTRTEPLAKLTINGGSATVAASGKLTAAEALVTGATATWNNAGILYIGDAAGGTLDIRARGAVGNAIGYVGNQAGSTGTVTIDGGGDDLDQRRRLVRRQLRRRKT